MPKHHFTAADLEAADLGPEELAALNGEDEPGEETPAPSTADARREPSPNPETTPAGLMESEDYPDSEDDEYGDDDDGEEPEGAGEKSSPQDSAEASKGGAADDTESATEKAGDLPALSFTDEDYQATQAALEQARKDDEAAIQQYDDGEIDGEQLKELRQSIRERYDTALKRSAAYEMEVQRREEALNQQWNAALEEFRKRGEQARYLATDPNGIQILDREIKRVYEDRPEASFNELLDTAYRRLHAMDPERYPMDAAKPPPGKNPPTDRQQAGRRDVPRTLGDAPSARGHDDKWAALDALDEEKLEAALARMSPEERDAYLGA